MATTNSTILGKFVLAGTNDYAQRLGDVNSQPMTTTIRNLFDPLNRDIWNSFTSFLINRIGMSYCRNQSFSNGLDQYIKSLNYGSTVQEVQAGWVKAHNYDHLDTSALLRSYPPIGLSAYHNVNDKRYYPIEVNEIELREAFSDEYGLNQFVASVMQAPINSDAYDTYRTMLQLFATYDQASPIFTVHYDSMPSDQASAQALLADMVAWSYKITYPSALYNATGSQGEPIATFANPSEMSLFVTPELYGHIGVQGLGMLFNIEQGTVPYRVTVVDEFPIDGVFAILTTSDFFQCYRKIYETMSFTNAATLSTTYFLHDQMVQSVSPFVPVVAFGTRSNSSTLTVTQTTTSMSMDVDKSTVEAGDTAQITITLNGSVTGDSTDTIQVEPNAATFELSSTGVLNSRTYVDRFGVLHTQKSNLKSGDTITIKATSTYVNPSGSTNEYTAEATVTIV